jgi:hypothetical protein
LRAVRTARHHDAALDGEVEVVDPTKLERTRSVDTVRRGPTRVSRFDRGIKGRLDMADNQRKYLRASSGSKCCQPRTRAHRASRRLAFANKRCVAASRPSIRRWPRAFRPRLASKLDAKTTPQWQAYTLINLGAARHRWAALYYPIQASNPTSKTFASRASARPLCRALSTRSCGAASRTRARQ